MIEFNVALRVLIHYLIVLLQVHTFKQTEHAVDLEIAHLPR